MKLYAVEEAHEAVRSLEGIVVSVLARVEVPAALWRKERSGELDAEQASVLVRAFEVDLLGAGGVSPRFTVVALPAPVLEHAAALAATHGLRAYDAVQMASATAARGADRSCDSFACFDLELRTAAAAQGFMLVP